MPGDPEVEAMQKLASALEQLDEGARLRVIDWAAQRYGTGLSKGKRAISSHAGTANTLGDFDSFVDLFDSSSPKSEPERALIGGYWFQVCQGQPSFTGQQVNDALKDLGHGIGNVTVAIGSLQERKPSLVRQVSKSGRSKQARKTYKLTSNGITSVERMLSGGEEDEEK